MNTIYVHYGSDKFDYKKMKKYMNMYKEHRDDALFDLFTKHDDLPIGFVRMMNTLPMKPIGLWASRNETKFGWKDWCELENQHTERLKEKFEFKIKDNAKILTINSEDDIIPYISESFDIMDDFVKQLRKETSKTHEYDKLDRKKLMEEYDGIEIPDICAVPRFSIFYTYDCDSICIWNPDVIIPV